MSKTSSISIPFEQTWSLTARWPALATMMIGLTVLYFVGFCPFQRAHNAAHDTRHSNGFPCH
jgi:cobalt transporter subunit CbtB